MRVPTSSAIQFFRRALTRGGPERRFSRSARGLHKTASNSRAAARGRNPRIIPRTCTWGRAAACMGLCMGSERKPRAVIRVMIRVHSPALITRRARLHQGRSRAAGGSRAGVVVQPPIYTMAICAAAAAARRVADGPLSSPAARPIAADASAPACGARTASPRSCSAGYDRHYHVVIGLLYDLDFLWNGKVFAPARARGDWFWESACSMLRLILGAAAAIRVGKLGFWVWDNLCIVHFSAACSVHNIFYCGRSRGNGCNKIVVKFALEIF